MPLSLAPRLALLTAVLTFGAGTALAQSTEEPAPPAAEEQAPAQAEAAPTPSFDADTVVTTVDGTPITLGEIIAIRQSLPDEYQQLPDEVLMNGLVQQLIDQQLLANAAHAAGLRDLPSVRLSLRNQERAVLADAYMAQELLARVDAEAIQTAYDEQYASAEPVKQARAAHILVETEDAANALKTELDGGADFAALAAEHGTDGTASRGGDLGWFSEEQMVPQFAEAVFAMEPGTVSAPVETPFGWHLIKLEDKRDRPVPPLAEVQSAILSALTEKAQIDIIAERREAAKIATPEVQIDPAQLRQDALIEN